MLSEFHVRQTQVLAVLETLESCARQVGAKSLSSRLRDRIRAKLEKNRFHLVVVGEFNHGKTSFINALLGTSLLPVGVTPTTAVIHELEFANEPYARVVYESGQEQDMDVHGLKVLAIGNPAPSPDPGPIRVLRVGYPARLLEDQIVLIDTPGVNDLSLQRADITYSYIPNSDAVLFLLDAGQPLKESERVFLADKLLGQSRDKIVFVLAKKDLLSPEELTEALGYVKERLDRLVTCPNVFPVSAEQALRGDRRGSGVDDLLKYLMDFLANERGPILLDNVLREATVVCQLLEQGVEAKIRGVQMPAEQIGRRIAQLEQTLSDQTKTLQDRRTKVSQEVASVKTWAQRDLQRFIEDVIQQIPSIVDKADADDLRSHLGPFLEKTFRDWATAETQEIGDALDKIAESAAAMLREDARGLGKKLAESLGSDFAPPAIQIDTFAYDIGVAALATLGVGVVFANWMLGGLLMLAAPVLALYMRDRAASQTRAKLKEQAPIALRQAAQRMEPKLCEMIDHFGEQIDSWVGQAGEELLREVLEVLQHARDERSNEQYDGTIARATSASLQSQVLSAKEQVDALRASLWDGRREHVASQTPQ